MSTSQPLLYDCDPSRSPDIFDEENPSRRRECPPKSEPCLAWRLLLAVSILANIVLAFALLSFHRQHALCSFTSTVPISPFASLRRNTPTQWRLNHAGTVSQWSDLWSNHSSFAPGIIALPDSYAQAHGLPRSQRWPWDRQKGVYLVNAYHNLHCVQRIREALEDLRNGVEERVPWPHVQHCLLALRDEIRCNADDTPRYTGFQADKSSGYGQTRLCRDWSQLEAWVQDPVREGCWKDVPGVEERDRYRFCSDGNRYKEIAEEE